MILSSFDQSSYQLFKVECAMRKVSYMQNITAEAEAGELAVATLNLL